MSIQEGRGTAGSPEPAFAGPPPLVVALGGNALVRPGDEGTSTQQFERARAVARELVRLDAPGGLVVTHGNGPQVGQHLLRGELARDVVPPPPLDTAVAATQGEIGVVLQQCICNALTAIDDDRAVAAVVTQVRVEADDPAFREPTKFVGRFYDHATAHQLASSFGWAIKRDADRGWRRVVPSPRPVEIVEARVIANVARGGAICIACGGGGIPVVRLRDGRLVGVEAVVDKDRATAVLAAAIGAKDMVIVTGVSQVCLGYGTPRARPLSRMTLETAARHLSAGEFPAGSMGPKIEAAIDFLARGGERVRITSPEALHDALAGRGPCTMIVP